MQYSSIIIEDDPVHRKLLQSALIEHWPEINVLACTGSIKDGAAMLEQFVPDILFLDVKLLDGSGFELLENIEDPSYVIIVSGYKEYAYDAFKQNAIDFIAKPLDQDELDIAISKAKRLIRLKSQPSEKITDGRLVHSGKIIVSSKTSILHIIDMENILYFKAEGKYTFLFVKDYSFPVISSKNLKVFEEIAPDNFVRVHNSYFVNVKYCQSILKDDYVVVMASGSRIPISTRKMDFFLEQFRRF